MTPDLRGKSEVKQFIPRRCLHEENCRGGTEVSVKITKIGVQEKWREEQWRDHGGRDHIFTISGTHTTDRSTLQVSR